jgi:hypothetical protein
VLQAIRENEFRAEAIGYRVVVYRTTSSILSALFATLAGAMLAIWLRYNGPDTSLSFEIMLDVLLIVVIGGMGTIYGAAIGSGLFVVAQSYLQDLLKLASDAPSRAAVAGGAAVAGPLAAVAGRAVRAVGLLLPHRHRRRLRASGARPGQRVQLEFYARLAADLFEQLGIEKAHWVGTSMGGRDRHRLRGRAVPAAQCRRASRAWC